MKHEYEHHEKRLREAFRALEIDLKPTPGHREELFRQVMEKAQRAQERHPRPLILRLRPWAVAASALILVGVLLWPLLSDSWTKSALAAAFHSASAARMVKFRQRVILPDGEARVCRMMISGDRWRVEYGEGKVQIADLGRRQMLTFNTITKKGLERRLGPDSGNPLENILELTRGGATYTGTAKLRGRTAYRYNVQSVSSKVTVWVDPQTNLLVRVESSEQSERGPTRLIIDHIQWNCSLDDSLFSVALPKGYALKVAEIPATAETVREFLKMAAEINGGAFPPRMDEVSITKLIYKNVPRVGVSAGNKMGVCVSNPSQEDEDRLLLYKRAMYFLQTNAGDGKWGYSGSGVTLGDGNKIVCWWTSDSGSHYTAIYGDLSQKEVPPADVPRAPE